MSIDPVLSFEEKVKSYILEKSLFTEEKKVMAAVSGGADSVALLLCLHSLLKNNPGNLCCVHIHHGLRKESDEEAVFVENLCKSLGILFYYKKVDVKSYVKDSHEGIEEAARKLRYQAFEEAVKEAGADVVATAHNANDVSETFLFHAFRGTGTEGLGSIPPQRDVYVRPFLCVTRDEIEAYLNSRGQMYCKDASNDTDDFSRNVIRHSILPVALKINSCAVEHIANAGEQVREMNEYVKRQADILYQAALIEDEKQVVLSRGILSMSDDILIKQVVRSALSRLTNTKKDITKAHVDSVLGIIRKEGTRSVNLPYKVVVTAEHDKVSFAFQDDAVKEDECLEIVEQNGTYTFSDNTTITWYVKEYDSSFTLPENECTKCWDYDKIVKPLVVRRSKDGDYLRIHKGESKKTVSNLLTDLKLPKAERKALYVLAEPMEVLWVLGVRRSETAYVTDTTKRILYMEVSKEVSNGEASCQRINQ